MNWVFWLAVVIIVLGGWVSLRHLFKDIGTTFLDIVKELIDGPDIRDD